MRLASRILAIGLAGLTLAACGEGPTSAPGRTSTRTIVSVPEGVGGLGELARNHLGGSAYDDGAGAEVLRAARRTLETAPGLESEFVMRGFGRYRGGADTGNAREVSARYKVIWARPSKFRADVGETSEGDLTGARIASADGTTFTIRAPGLLGFIPRKVAADDARLKNVRGHSLVAVSPDAQLARLTATQAVWTVIGEGRTPAGEPTVRIGVQNVAHLDEEIDREELELVKGTLAIYQYAAYVGMRRVLAYDFASFRWTAPAPEAFGL
jgi:hypothetical protein